jgi:hypothetical protein
VDRERPAQRLFGEATARPGLSLRRRPEATPGGHTEEANAGSIPRYGERYRSGEPISSSFVESAVNQVVSKRMVKKQQMRWSPRGAHLLLQVRTRVLNDDLADDFHRWYPSFTHTSDRQSMPG